MMTAFWLIVSLLFWICFLLQWHACQQRADEANFAGLVWEGSILCAIAYLAISTWPF